MCSHATVTDSDLLSLIGTYDWDLYFYLLGRSTHQNLMSCSRILNSIKGFKLNQLQWSNITLHLSAPSELKFEKERLTPEELNEENCCNLILPRPFHPKFAKLDTKDPTRCLAAAAHFLIRKKLFNSKVTQLHVAKVFAVAEKKLHLTISGRKYDPGKKASKRKLTTDVKTADPQPSTSKDESTSTQPPQAETISEQQPEDTPSTEQQQESKTGSTQQAQDDSTSTLQSQDESVPEQ